MLARLKQWASVVKRDVLALYLAMRDPRVPWPVKLLAATVAGYALSPIDLIPDFIPVIGYLDDLILLPLGILLVVRLIPDGVMEDLRRKAEEKLSDSPPRSRAAAVAIIALWMASVVGLAILMFPETFLS